MLGLEDVGLALLRVAGGHARRRYEVRLVTARPLAGPRAPEPPVHADERTARQIAEAQHGGVSSAEGSARWESGENPGGLHHKAPRAPDEEAARAEEPDEPQGRRERVRHGERCMPAARRGS